MCLWGFRFDPDFFEEEVVSNLKNYCEPRKNIIFQRFKFASCVQLEGQGFDDFVTELKN